jgi:hypothetical protein
VHLSRTAPAGNKCHGATFEISGIDGTLANARIDHPAAAGLMCILNI